MKNILLSFFIFLLCVSAINANAQTSNATLFGRITNTTGDPIELVSVSLRDYPFGTTSKRNGAYLLRIPSKRTVTVVFSFTGYETIEKELNLEPEQNIEFDVVMTEKSESIDEITVLNRQQNTGNMVRIDPKLIGSVSSVGSGSIEGMIKTFAGVTSSNELSSQYSVRGGSFDENLVYVNDIEIYRPFLIRSGQQEGLSFVNTDMVSTVEFSAGGFDAKFGDKMSSVLNITYKRPSAFGANVSASLLGTTAHIENTSKNGELTYNMGIRYKTFQYLYGTLKEKGEYRPRFFDYQGYFTYAINRNWELGFLGSVSNNDYTFVPVTRSSEFGTWNMARNLTVYFDGQEADRYRTNTAALSLAYQPSRNFFLKLILSAYNTDEEETYDIIGYYNFNELGRQPGTKEYGDSILNLGAGIYHEHGRNFYPCTSFEHSHKRRGKIGQPFPSVGR
jgi:hypothetical protein